MNATEIIRNVNKSGGSYHTLHFPDGTVLQGIFDMSDYLQHYKIPDLKGKTVLDIGTGSGYFAFEFAKMGAKRVVAISDVIGEVHHACNELMGTNVEFLQKDLYTLDESFGKFDLTFCSQVFQHIPDIYTATEKIYSVTKDLAIFGINIIADHSWDNVPVAIFGGFQGDFKGYKFPSYWIPSRSCCFKMMTVAGFKDIQRISFFEQFGEYKTTNKIPTEVFHAFV